MPHPDMMHRSPPGKLGPSILAVLLALAAPVAAQSGGTGIGPVEGAVATVEYTIEQAMNGTSPPGNGTTPPSGNGTNPPPGNGTNPPGGNGTNPGNGTPPGGNNTTPPGGNNTVPPDGNETTPPDGNETNPPDGNETAPPDGNETTPPPGNETAPPDGNETAPPQGNETSPPDGNSTAGGGGAGGGASGSGGDQGAGGAAGDAGTGSGEDAPPGFSTDSLQGSGSKSRPCLGLACSGSGPAVPYDAGFPWLPLLVTLIVAPIVGLFAARMAIRRWNITKPSRRPQAVQAGPKGPSDALDPMRQFLMDVKEWKAIPQPGADPAPAPSSG